MTDTTTPQLTIMPANEASWEDLRGGIRHAWRFRELPLPALQDAFPRVVGVGRAEELAARLRVQTECGHPASGSTSGLLAYLDGAPVGWCAVEPRTAYPRLLRDCRVPWLDRDEDKADDGVWAVTCILTRADFGNAGSAARSRRPPSTSRGTVARERSRATR